MNRLKRGFIWTDHPDNTDPPRDIDAVEPAILGDNEVPDANFACPSDNDDDSTRNVDQNRNGNGQNDGDEYEIEKILRKKFVNDKLHYRVKWHGYNSSENSWVSYDNLNDGHLGQNDGDEYEIEKILRKKFVNDKWHYRVKWHGYNSSENSWVSYDNLNEKCQDYVKKFHKKIPTDRNSKQK